MHRQENELNLTENAQTVLNKRYLKKDENGNPLERPEDMFRRVANNIAQADRYYDRHADVRKTEDEFYSLMTSLEFLPNSPTLMNAGRDLQQLSACFVLELVDSMEGIFETLKNCALIHKSGGGTGMSFARLRPRGSMVKSTSGIASGPVSFLKVFDAATQAVKQGGTRRGANMGILRVDHPDILEFITCKEDDKSITNFNISVAVTDDFMQKVASGEDYDLINPHTGKSVNRLNAKKVFDLIIKQAHKNGEPGIIFIDRMNQFNPTPKLGEFESTNPCVTGDTLVSTEKGLMKIRDIADIYGDGGLNILTDDRVLDILYNCTEGNVATQTKPKVSLNRISAAFKTGKKPVLKLVTESGFEIKVTADHKIMTLDGWVAAGDLKPGLHKVLIQTSIGGSNDNTLIPFDDVKSVMPYGEEEVYDLTEPSTRSFVANGIVISNCGEQILLPYESCNLGSINLAKMLVENSGKAEVNWDRLAKTTHTAVHFLDNVIDMNRYPVKRIEQMTKANRKIGLGIMGFADMLIALGIPYNSDEAVALGEKVMKFILDEATKASVDLAKKRNSFPNFKDSIYATGAPIRNATLTTIAPTGTLSIIAGSSSGIEPIFSICYYRKVLDGAKLMEVNPYFEKIAKDRGFYSEQLMEKISQQSSMQNIEEIPQDVRKVFVTAHDITPLWHIKMQAAFQLYTNNAVSKTINFPYEAGAEDVRGAYMLAYKSGCKGVTIYRDRSRQEQVLNIDRGARTTELEVEIKEGTKEAMEKQEKSEELEKAVQQVQPSKEKIAPRPRPKVVCGTTTKVQTGCGNLYVTINEDDQGRPFEVFTQMGKAGGCAASQLEAVGRLVSLALRSGIDIKSIIDQLEGIRCPSPSWEKGGRIFSCADAIGKVIEKRLLQKGKSAEKLKKDAASGAKPHMNSQETEGLGKDSDGRGKDLAGPQYDSDVSTKNKISDVVGVCPDCGGALHYQEGCMICHSCGFTKCG